MKRVTIKDVAKEAGVSISMVSFVIGRDTGTGKKRPTINEKTAERVIDAANRLNYIPNWAASNLRTGRQYSIGVIVPDIANRFFSDIARHIENIASDAGYSVMFSSSDENSMKMDKIVDSFLCSRVEGIIIAPSSNSCTAVRHVIDAEIPVVLIDRDIPGARCGRVLIDNVRAGSTAVECLYKAGYRKIEMLNYTLNVSSVDDRARGYRQKMTEYGLADHIRVVYTVYGSAEEDIRNYLADAVARGVEAVILPTNTISVFGLKALRNLGVRIPDQLAVFCFDQSDVYNIYSPTVTRIIQPTDAIARESFMMLRNMIEKSEPAGESVILPFETIIGESTKNKSI